MEILTDHVFLSRLQFAITALFHMLWPLLTVGLSLFLVAVETAWLRTGDEAYYHHARFWGRLLLLNFGVGVVSGIPLQFEFGTNWAPFSITAGDFFGNILGFEAAMAFMLEAGFLGIMMFGWKRVSPGIHLFATCMVALGASLSAFWIMIASGWMHTPAGVHIENGVIVVDSYLEAIFHPSWFTSVTHMWLACLATTAFVVGGISAWYVLKDRNAAFFSRSFKVAAITAIIVLPLQIVTGDMAGLVMAEHQPAKLAATEAHWDTNPPGEGAPWVALAWPDPENGRNAWSIEVPDVLSVVIAHSPTGKVRGLNDFDPADRPPVLLPFYAFRAMLGIGFLLLAVAAWTALRAWRAGFGAGALAAQPRLLRAWVLCIPLGYIAADMGWIVREVGRQPWVVQGWLRTSDMASSLPPSNVAATAIGFSLVYGLLFIGFLVFARRLVMHGPDLDAPVPARHGRLPFHAEPGVELGDAGPMGGR
jgi:cytochrome d ubiquinol oxidase subunit I